MSKKGRRYRKEQIICILKEVEFWVSVMDVCRRYGVLEQTMYH